MERRCAICRKVIGSHDQFLADNKRTEPMWVFVHTRCVEMTTLQVKETVHRFIERIKVVGIQLKLAELRKRPGYKGDRWQK